MHDEATMTTERTTYRIGTIFSWICQIAMAAILVQTLFFKFTYAPETQVIFADIGGRLAATAVGLAELTCVVLLLVPRTAVLGALLATGVMAGAIGTHLFVIGIEVVDPATGKGDGGTLFALALTVTVLALVVLALRRAELSAWVARLRR